MKTGMEGGLVVIVILVALAIGMSIVNAQQVEMATAQVQASTAAAQMPMAQVAVGQLGGWLLKFAIGVVVAGVGGLAFAWLRSKLRPSSRRAWRNGPNAQWQGKKEAQQPRERGLTMTDMLKFMTLLSGKQTQQPPHNQTAKPAEEPKIWS
ncbi:MAG TPA: hypothetical protein DCG54_07500 [Anaerolineae bacterium]|jgi:hypothetical protein|nr:hypothetical protein [Anaerolineae bacterium]